MANILSHQKRLDVLGGLVGGMNGRRIEEKTGVHHDTIGRFGFAVGVGCERIHDRMARDLSCPLVDMDEQHSWTYKRQIHIDPEKDDTSVMGERWTWASICRTFKLTIAWHVGKRDGESADALVGDTRARLSVMPQITTDGLALYVEPIGRHFGYGVDYAQTVKNPGDRLARAAGAPSAGPFLVKRTIFGAPDLNKATTYAIERSNLTNRTWNTRLIRRTLCFSKKVDRHDASIALGYVYRNLCHVPRGMKVTPAYAAGLTDHIWTLEELMVLALDEPAAEKPVAHPLTFRQPTTTARELPEGRGFLRMVPQGIGGASSSSGPAPTPPASPAAPVAPVQPSVADPSGQLDLLAWQPRPGAPAKPLPPPGTQLDLFGR